MLIEFIGIDGSGKTTQAELLKKHIIETKNKNACVLHGYYPYKYTQELNKYAFPKSKEEVFSPTLCSSVYLLDALDVLTYQIESLLSEQNIVILDKYVTSSLVYGPILGCDEKIIKKLIDLFLVPDFIIFLNISPQTAFERIVKRGEALQKKESLSVMDIAVSEFQKISNRENCISIDAECSVDKVHNQIKKFFEEMINNGKF